jgi:hypothetical protein
VVKARAGKKRTEVKKKHLKRDDDVLGELGILTPVF